MTKNGETANLFGGEWTEKKLKILGGYLNSYTTALKNQDFHLVYIDAFAGSGDIETKPKSRKSGKEQGLDFFGILSQEEQEDEEMVRRFLEGSVKIALEVKNKPFDEMVFIEKNTKKFQALENLCAKYPNRNIRIENAEANETVRNLKYDWEKTRGVLFLDPFGTAVEWQTLETVEKFKALDTWILFPTSALLRILKRSREPNDILEAVQKKLEKVFGDNSWEKLYEEEQNLLGEIKRKRAKGTKGLLSLYKKKLEKLFGARFMQTSGTLKNSNNSEMFEFMFCVGHHNGAETAKRIAEHLIKNI